MNVKSENTLTNSAQSFEALNNIAGRFSQDNKRL